MRISPLRQRMTGDMTVRHEQPRKLPTVLTQEEVDADLSMIVVDNEPEPNNRPIV
jgi:hypothetical protein